MPPSKSLFLFDDCRVTLDAALDAGAEVDCETYARAVVFRRRCNHFRKLDRESNYDIFSEDDPRRGKSAYDTLELSIPKPPRDYFVVIKPRHIGPFKIYPLGTFTAKPPGETTP